MPGILENIERVNSRIAAACERAGRAVEEVKLVIVTKNASVEEIKEVVRLGYTELGESRAQRLADISIWPAR